MRWFGRRNGLRSPAAPECPQIFETLEDRLALYQGPMISNMPPLAALENPFDTVVRIDTNMGKIDVELFDNTAQAAVTAFKKYINSGRFDEMFFDSLGGGQLAAGSYKYVNGAGLSTITLDPTFANGFSRSNLAQTLAMIPTSSTTAQSRWMINLQDNIPLNTLNGGYTVFGKVIQGWNIVQAIAALGTQNLNQALLHTPTGPFTTTPVRPGYNPGVGPTEATLVRITDIEVVKTYGSTVFFQQTLVFPEGFRSNTTVERIDLVNLDQNQTNFYQIIVRYETGDRDNVILTGSMQKGARVSLKINDAAFPNYNIVRPGVGYAFEIRTTLAFAASLDHRDNNITLGQSFQILARLFPGQLTTWSIAGADKGPGYTSYLVWQNLTDIDGVVNVKLIAANGTTILNQYNLKAARRGGVNVAQLANVPDGAYTAYITSNVQIVAALSQYKTISGVLGTGAVPLGTITGGAVEGYLAGAWIPTGGSSSIDLYYNDPNTAVAIVDLQFTLTNGTVLNGVVTLTSAARRQRVDLATINPSLPISALAAPSFFSIHYSSRNNVTPITASYATRIGTNATGTPFQTTTSARVTFADGFLDPTQTSSQMLETISVFNPYAHSPAFFYDLAFHFSDGTVLYGAAPGVFSLNARQRADHRVTDFANVMAKINSSAAFRFYSVEVISTQFTPGARGGVIAQITREHYAWGQSYTSIPALHQDDQLLFVNDPEFH